MCSKPSFRDGLSPAFSCLSPRRTGPSTRFFDDSTADALVADRWHSPAVKAMHAAGLAALYDWKLGAVGLELGSWLEALSNCEYYAACAAVLQPNHAPACCWGASGVSGKVCVCRLASTAGNAIAGRGVWIVSLT